jgi:hypothetical protein
MAFCLPKYIVDDFIAKLKDGTINPQKMMDMTSAQRRDFLADIVGEDNAFQVNAKFEKKLLLKDQQQGIINWAKEVAGLDAKKRKNLIERVNDMEEILTPESEDAFLEDLAAQKLGVAVTAEEAQQIADLAKTAMEKREVMESKPRRKPLQPGTNAEMEYGRAGMAFRNYIRDLKLEAGRLTIAEFKASPVATTAKVAKLAAGVSKSLKASLDLSALGRQGWKVLMSHPSIWYNQATKTFQDVIDTFGGKTVMDEVNAWIISNPNYDNMLKDGLAVTVIEEEFPESELIERVPGLGIVHKAAEQAFTAFMYRNRADLYDYYTEVAKQNGYEKTTGLGIGHLANSLGSRGHLGRLEPAADVVNVTFFSLRNLKANFDVLTAHMLGKDVSWFVKKQAAINLVKILSGTAAVLALARAMGGDVEEDPRSADFGKIKVGNTRFDVTGGAGSIIVLANRLARQSYKSSTTGKVTPLNTGEFGSRTSEDMVYDFFANKFSPAFSVVRNLLRGRTFQGEKPTLANTLRDLTIPISAETIYETYQDPNSADLLLTTIAEILGIGTQTYGPPKKKKSIFQ